MHMHAADTGVRQVPDTTLSRSLPAPHAPGMLGAASSLQHCLKTFSRLRTASPLPAHRPSLRRSVVMTATAQTEPAPADVKGRSLDNLKFDNRFTEDLPADEKKLNRLREVEDAVYTWVDPTPTDTEPHTLAASQEVARLIGLDLGELQRPEFAAIFSGNAPLPGAKPYAQCYGGHQFGYWAGQLGDGRAICLGEVVNEAGKHWELQLKGAGKTPFSRMADGRAVLRSSLREYVASEAMAALGVPTTRALSLVATGAGIYRDMFYDGDVKEEPGAVVCRVARSFVRFGTFQLPSARGGEQLGLVRRVADHVIRRHYSHLNGDNGEVSAGNGAAGEDGAASPDPKYLRFLKEVAERTAATVVHWHRVGFVHGVLNTDNMSILGDTIDYGPYAFMERFDPNYTPNTTDLPGRRYAFRAQPAICQFNVLMLGKAFVLAGLLDGEGLQEVVDSFTVALSGAFSDAMRRKLGLRDFDPGLYGDLMALMIQDKPDFTNTWRALSSVAPGDGAEGLTPALAAALGEDLAQERVEAWSAWAAKYRAVLAGQDLPAAERRAMQDAANPALIPRNHVMVSLIAEVESGNTQGLEAYLEALARPYEDGLGESAWKVPAPRQIRKGIELLSCSS
ncbi:hypothetical protein ACKKBG_A11885 [Auxenochlorella protothecoides x Auxenochlorella symbiontica]